VAESIERRTFLPLFGAGPLEKLRFGAIGGKLGLGHGGTPFPN
jgi:hypothetical protein